MHVYGKPRAGHLGVQIFFVLSGFLITTLLLQERERSGRISLRAFYRRRALRLLPALAAVVTAYAAATVAVSYGARSYVTPNLPAARDGIFAGLLYVTNIIQAWHGILPLPISHLWSLATEEQFYLLWPVALLVLLRRRATPQVLAWVLTAGIAAVAMNRIAFAFAGVSRRHEYFSPETTFDALLVGCLVGVWFVAGTGPRFLAARAVRRAAWPLAVAGIAAAIALPVTLLNRQVYSLVLVAFELAAALVILTAVLDERSLLSRALRFAPLRYVGRISYGLYLWHPVVLWSTGYVGPTQGVLLSLAVASGSYYGIERPFLRRKEQTAAPPAAAAAAAPA
jgi:peptidoglycan/LPS O-acetylase OafA/YrhL